MAYQPQPDTLRAVLVIEVGGMGRHAASYMDINTIYAIQLSLLYCDMHMPYACVQYAPLDAR